MGKYRKLSHVIYKCEYHIVFVPKYRYKILEGALKEFLEEEIKKLCEWKDVIIEEMNIQKDHIHMVVSIPPKISISEFMGFLKGKLAIKLFKSYPWMKKKPYWGKPFLGKRILRKHNRDR